MEKQKIVGLINRSERVQVTTVSSISGIHQIEDAIKAIRENLRKNSGKETVIVQILSK